MRRLVLLLALSACGTKSSPPASPDAAPRPAPAPAPGPIDEVDVPDTIPPPPVHRMWTAALASEEDFLAFSKEVAGERFGKFVIDLKTDAIYYFDVDVYRVHKDFVFAELYKKPRSKEADHAFAANYHAVKPEFLLCYLVHHLGPDKWTFAFWEGDRATPEQVTHAYQRMKETFYLGDQVAFRPDSTLQEKVAAKLVDVPVLDNDHLYKDAQYRAFNTGTAIGTLRVVPPGANPESLTFTSDEIVILPDVLPDITPVAGILSETFSTPLSHVSLRARAWGIPNVGFKGATRKYEGWAGKVVWFEARDADHALRLATDAEIAEWKEKKSAAKKVILPKADLETTELRTLDALRAADATAYGAKASNLGEIVHAGLTGFTVPVGFGVPIHFYDAHMKAAGLDATVKSLLKDKKFKKDAAYRKKKLDELRAAIVEAPLDPALHELLVAKVAEITGGDPAAGVFVRSSTNAEDLPGFNGAGLYDTVPNVKGPDALDLALKQVWASVWNLRAYEEREFFRIDHTRVFGAVLIQLGINATAAGVLVTVHPTDPSEKSVYTINAKSGLGIRVVEGKKVPESLLWDYKNNGLRVLSRSDEDTMLVFDEKGGVSEVPNTQKGQPILTDSRARRLGRTARALVKVFGGKRPLDIEWLFVNDDLFIVQARPYVTR